MTEQAASTRCRFLELPPELRYIIYGHLFHNIEGTQAQEILFDLLDPPISCSRPCLTQTGPYEVNILQTCSLIHNEACVVLYSHRRFQAVVDITGAAFLGRLLDANATDVTRYANVLSQLRVIDVTVVIEPFLDKKWQELVVSFLRSHTSVMRRCLLECRNLQMLNVHLNCEQMMFDNTKTVANLVCAIKEAEQEPRRTLELLRIHVCGPCVAAALEAFVPLPVRKNLTSSAHLLHGKWVTPHSIEKISTNLSSVWKAMMDEVETKA